MYGYRTIKELVIESCITEGGYPPYEKRTSLVMQHFPTSKWQKTHYAWDKSKIKTGEIPVPGVSGDATDLRISDGIETEVEESIEASLSLEKDLHSYLAAKIQDIESGLKLVEGGVEFQTEAGRIDLLAKDIDDRMVVIELKAGRAKDSALGQRLGYMGGLSSTQIGAGKSIRGVLIASNFDDRVVFAARGLPSVKLVNYQLSFDFRVGS